MEHAAMESLFLQYADDVYSYLSFLMGHTDVEDLVQETFLKAMRGLGGYRGGASTKTWLLTIARNTAVDDGRRRKRRPETIGAELDLIPATSPTPEMFAELQDLKRKLLSALEGFGDKYRDVVVLRVFMDVSTADAARILGWSESKVDVTLYRAIQRIRSKFEMDPGGGLREATR